MTAAQTTAALGKSEAAYQHVFAGFKKAMDENDVHGIFYNVLLITTLGGPGGQGAFDQLKVKFKDDENAMKAVDQFESSSERQ